jgi:hypothetical protein
MEIANSSQTIRGNGYDAPFTTGFHAAGLLLGGYGFAGWRVEQVWVG